MTDKKLTAYEMVREFHQAFKQPQVEGGPSLEAIEDRINLRMSLIAEEFIELMEAVYGKKAGAIMEAAWLEAKQADEGNRDLVETMDALADMIYVINGFAVEANSDLDAVVTHVHESNMSKLDENGAAIMSDGVTPDPRDGVVKPAGKILKGPNFWEPNIAQVLGVEK